MLSPNSTDSSAEHPLLSVVVITRNEAHNLPRLLASVEGLANEVVLFDSGSTDGTIAIAEEAGARVTSCDWEGWSATKNRANAAARGRWILSLDADEALTEASAAAVLAHIQGPVQNEQGAWRVGEINRLTRYCGAWVRHSGWYPDRKVRLWPAGSAQWEGAIHEQPVFDRPVAVRRLDGDVEHHSYPHPADHLHQIERFGAVWAEDQFGRGKRHPKGLVFLKVGAQWVKSFLIKAGFLDGRTGWTIAHRSAWATWRKHARLRTLQRPSPPPLKRILITRTDALGDLVVTLPMVRALKAALPGVEVDVLVRGYAVPVAQCAIGLDGVVEWRADWRAAEAADTLRRGQYDAVVHAFPEPAVVRAASAAGIRIRIATARRWVSWRRVTHRMWDSRRASGGHEAWHGLRLLMPLGVDPDRHPPTDLGLTAPQPDTTVRSALDEAGGSPILLHPGSHGSAGNWPQKRFAELALALAKTGRPVAFTGTEAEGQAFSECWPDHPLIHSFFGRFNLEQLLAVQASSALVIASSTGPLHTAAALGRPCIGLYGTRPPEWPERWRPLGPQVDVLSAEDRTEEGQLDLSVSSVMLAVERRLGAPG